MSLYVFFCLNPVKKILGMSWTYLIVITSRRGWSNDALPISKTRWTIPNNLCNMVQAKKAIQRHPIIITDADYDYMLDEIEPREKLSLKEIWVLIVTRNITDDNNHNSILNVFFHYIIIKYQYVNIIWIFICFYVFSILLDSVMFILFKE